MVKAKKFEPKRRVAKKRHHRGMRVSRTLIPKSRLMSMKYYTGDIGGITTTSIGYWVLRATGINDPQYSVGGGQCMGYDQIGTLYKRYRVVGVNIKARFHNTTSGTVSRVGIALQNSYNIGNSPSSLEQACERSGSVCRTITTEQSATIQVSYKPWNIEGISKTAYMSDAIYASAFGTTPTSQSGIVFFFQNVDESTSTNHVIDAEVTYDVLWDIPVQLALS